MPAKPHHSTHKRDPSSQTRSPLWRSCWLLLGVLAAGLMLDLPLSASSMSSDWPQWRGPERTGVSSETGLAASWPESGPAIVWRIDSLGEGFSSVATAGESIYTQGTQNGKTTVVALDAADGSHQWTTELGSRLVQDKGNGPRATPSIVGDDVYAITGTGILANLDRETGNIKWQVNLLARYGAKNIYWGFSESPLVIDGKIYVMPGGSKATVAALNAADGSEVWARDYGQDASYSSLVAAEFEGIKTLVGFTQQAGIGVRLSDGELLWSYAGAANRTANAATPVISNDLVIYSSGYGTGSGAIRVSKDGKGLRADEVWFAAKLQNHHGGIVLYDGHLYGFFGNALACADVETGEVKWQSRSVGKGSLTIADGKLFLLGERHKVGLAEATPEAYREGGQFALERIREPAWAYPVVSNGRLYIRDQSTLTAYSVGGE